MQVDGDASFAFVTCSLLGPYWQTARNSSSQLAVQAAGARCTYPGRLPGLSTHLCHVDIQQGSLQQLYGPPSSECRLGHPINTAIGQHRHLQGPPAPPTIT